MPGKTANRGLRPKGKRSEANVEKPVPALTLRLSFPQLPHADLPINPRRFNEEISAMVE